MAWQEFTTDLGTESISLLYPNRVNMPGQWSRPDHAVNTTSQYPTGYETYALDVILPSNITTSDLAIGVNSANPATHWIIIERGTGEARSGKF